LTGRKKNQMKSIYRVFSETWSSTVAGKEKDGESHHHRDHQRHRTKDEEARAPFQEVGLVPEQVIQQDQDQDQNKNNLIFIYDSSDDMNVSVRKDTIEFEDNDADKSVEDKNINSYTNEDDRMVTHEQEITHMDVEFQNHKKLCNSVLVDYIIQRLSRHDKECKDASNNSRSTDIHHEQDKIRLQKPQTFQKSQSDCFSETLEPESQPIHDHDVISRVLNSELLSHQFHQQQRGIGIEKPTHFPPIATASHTIHLVSQIDLFTNTLFLDLCRIETIFPLRKTNRMTKSITDNMEKQTANSSKQLDLSQLTNFQFGRHADDGPLFGIYEQVLSMDILQLDTPTQQKFHHATSTLYPTAKLYRRLVIYFYDQYAINAHKFLQSHPNCNYYCCLMDIPAICIFPYRTQPNGWFDDDLSDYIVCVGGKSRCCVNQDTNRLHFEHQDMKVILLAVSDPVQPNVSASFTEYILGSSGMTKSTSPNLLEALKSWKICHGILPNPAADVDSLINVPPQDEPPAKRPRKMQYSQLVRVNILSLRVCILQAINYMLYL
jgi:hypothetical protein